MSTERTKISIQSGQQLLQHPLQGGFLFLREQSPFVGASQKMPDLVQRAARDANEPLMITWRGPSIPFRNICPDAVSRPHELMTNCGFGERFPKNHRIPNQIGQLLGHRIDSKIFEREFGHGQPATTLAAV